MAGLSGSNHALTRKFLHHLRLGSLNSVNKETALIFLTARKYELSRSLQLFDNHLDFRIKHELCDIDPQNESFQKELSSGRFLVTRLGDGSKPSVLLLNGEQYKRGQRRLEVWLKSIIFQMDQVLKDREMSQSGVVLVCDMTGVKLTSIDVGFYRNMLRVMKSIYPVSVKQILVVNCGYILQKIVGAIMLLFSTKLQKRMVFLEKDMLKEYVSEDALPKDLGGTFEFSYNKWFNQITKSYYIFDRVKGFRVISSVNLLRTNANIGQSVLAAQNDLSFEELRNIANDVQQLSMHYKALCSESHNIAEKCSSSLSQNNLEKNRYQNIPCFDHTGVRLPNDNCKGVCNEAHDSSYIHANYINGFEAKKRYIATQGPLPNTFNDFWKMVWTEKSIIIVMLANIIENGRIKCHPYWPLKNGEILTYENIRVKLLNTIEYNDYALYNLTIEFIQKEEIRNVSLFRYLSWPDFGVPSTAAPLLSMIHEINTLADSPPSKCAASIEDEHTDGSPPIVIHCSAGVGRTGTYCTIDICCQQLRKTGKVNVIETVRKLRRERYGMIQVFPQYQFCYKAILEYANYIPELTNNTKN